MRITSSTCYELFTYSKNKNPNWEKKITTYFSDSFAGNFATEYGLEKEDEAVDVVQRKTGLHIFTTGLLIHPKAPWLGYSPDGLFIMNGKLKILEVKCPIQGASTTATEIMKSLKYVFIGDDGSYKLKNKHKYYGQVQCGMHITNVDQCYFIIYAPFDKIYVLLIVQRDENFIKTQFAALHNIYFKYCLPYVLEINHL